MTELVNKYIELRMAKKNVELVALLTDNIVIDSNGTEYSGKPAVLQYFNDNPPEGEWQPAEDSENGVIVNGKVERMWMWWDVRATFTLSDDKITNIVIARV
jgi:hypothetical protein